MEHFFSPSPPFSFSKYIIKYKKNLNEYIKEIYHNPYHPHTHTTKKKEKSLSLLFFLFIIVVIV